VTALIDWELAHIGDPVEDLAWLSMRSVFAPVPDLAALVKRYETSSGLVVDRDRLLYHRVFVQWRVAVIRHLAIGDPDPGGDVGTGLISQAVNRRLLVEAMAQASGVPLSAPPPLDAGHDGPRDWLYEAVLALVRNDIAPHLLDPVGAARSRSVSRIVKYLRDQERLAPAAQARELASLRNLLGNVEDLESARHELVRRVVEKRVPLSTTIPHLWLVVSDETDMQRSGLGALADAHLPVF
jgi:Predicted aminoglycoside phosphotransferase